MPTLWRRFGTVVITGGSNDPSETMSPTDLARRRRSRRMCHGAVATVFLSVPGCGVVPSVNILGSFFPAWLISIVIGVVLTVLTRQVFMIAKFAPDLHAAAVTYACLVLLWTLATWLVVFAS